MTRMLALILCLTPLAACGPIRSPGSIAASTTLDEKAGRAATDAYTAASMIGRQLALAGRIDREKFKALDQIGYDAVISIRAAYLLGNATDYAHAITLAQSVVAQMKAL